MRTALTILVATCIALPVFAQDYTASNLAKDKEWQIVEMAFAEVGYEMGTFSPDQNTLTTNWISWTTVAIQNRGIVQVKRNGQHVEISMIERSYKSGDKWAQAIGNLSKKNKKKYLQKLVDKINEINGSDKMIALAVQNSVLFPAFNPVTTVNGIAWRVDSILQRLDAADKDLILYFTITNTTSAPVSIEAVLWNPNQNFFGIPATLTNYKVDGTSGGDLIKVSLSPKEGISKACYFKATKEISSVPKYVLSFRIEGVSKRQELIIHDMPVPYKNITEPTF